jgi:hypothetical protein
MRLCVETWRRGDVETWRRGDVETWRRVLTCTHVHRVSLPQMDVSAH